MTNSLKAIISYDDDNWEDYLIRICLYDVFKELVEKYKDRKKLLKSLIRYIVWTYSVESEKVSIGSDWLENKMRIFDAAGLDRIDDIILQVVHLRNETILLTVKRWLDFQNNDTFNQLSILKDLRAEMQLSCLSDIKKSSGETDYSQKFLNAEYAIKLKSMIKDLEAELIQNNPKMKQAYEDIKKATKVKNTVGPESFAT